MGLPGPIAKRLPSPFINDHHPAPAGQGKQAPVDPSQINSPAPATRANPHGAVVRLRDGYAAYNDDAHEVVFSPDGQITVFDRTSRGSEERELNFMVRDGYVYHRNPYHAADASEPEFLRTRIPPEGMEILMSDGTTLFLDPTGNGELDVTITSVGEDADRGDGVIARFEGVGSGERFDQDDNVSVESNGGQRFKERWESTHPDGGKHGSPTKVWVRSMASGQADEPHGEGRRVQGQGEWDEGQEPGGFSMRSDRRYDVNAGIGKTMRHLFYDLGGIGVDAEDALAGVPPFAATGAADLHGLATLTPEGAVVYDDGAHQVEVSRDGRITVYDHAGPGGRELRLNFTVWDEEVTYHNPKHYQDETEPEFLSAKVPAAGMELLLSDGTTIFLEHNGNGTLDMAVTQGNSVVRWDDVGSGVEWEPGHNLSAAVSGGETFVARWEATHDSGYHWGSPAKVWVTPMNARPQEVPHREERKQGANGTEDLGQEPGGFSQRSDRRYDTKGGLDFIFYDLKGEPAEAPPLEDKPTDDSFALLPSLDVGERTSAFNARRVVAGSSR